MASKKKSSQAVGGWPLIVCTDFPGGAATHSAIDQEERIVGPRPHRWAWWPFRLGGLLRWLVSGSLGVAFRRA
jgi:hypothetical protein